MTLADRLKAIRKATGKSQTTMAKEADSSLPSWQGYEAGKNIPGGNVLEALSRLGYSVDWLLTGEGEMRRGDKAYSFSKSDDFKKVLLRVLEAIEAAETLGLCSPSSLAPKERTALVYAMLVHAESIIKTGEALKYDLYTLVPMVLSVVQRHEEMNESAKVTGDIADTNLGKLLDAVTFVFNKREVK